MHERCEVCGKPATNVYREAREIEPERGADGSLYRVYEPVGSVRHFCDEHHPHVSPEEE